MVCGVALVLRALFACGFDEHAYYLSAHMTFLHKKLPLMIISRGVLAVTSS